MVGSKISNCALRFYRTLRQIASEFCLLTAMPGYKYIVQPGKHTIERLFWSATVAVSMSAALYLMKAAYEFNADHPTILAVNSTHWPVWDVEAPAITICPTNKVEKSRARKLADSLILPPNVSRDDVFEDLALLVELIIPRYWSVQQPRLERLQDVLDYNNLNVDVAMKRVSPKCSQMLIRCRWKRRQCRTCADIFRRVRTADGYCCSFNYLDSTNRIYNPYLGGCVTVPSNVVKKVSSCGYTSGLSVLVNMDFGEYHSSLMASHGVKVMVHNPYVYPDSNTEEKLVGPGLVTFLSYSTQIIFATERLRTLTPDIRRCHFPEETFLPMYPNYTYNNCMASCRANYTIEICGCVPFTFPYILNRTICNLRDISCVALIREPMVSLWSGDYGVKRDHSRHTCSNCKPLCSSVVYHAETSTGTLHWDNLSHTDSLIGDLIQPGRHSVIHVFPSDLVATRLKMDRFLTSADLLGSLGGLSGLFLGFSLVSGFELIYFFTIRLFFQFCERPSHSQEQNRQERFRCSVRRRKKAVHSLRQKDLINYVITDTMPHKGVRVIPKAWK